MCETSERNIWIRPPRCASAHRPSVSHFHKEKVHKRCTSSFKRRFLTRVLVISSTANGVVPNYLACLFFVLPSIPPNLNSQVGLWSNRREAQLVTDPATGAIWYIGGTASGGDMNEVDKFLNDAWNTNVPTVKKDAGTSGAGTSAIMGSYSAGTSHLIDGKIYIFGGFATAASSPRTYQTFQNLPWLDISTTPPTIGTQVHFFSFFFEG